MRSRAEREADYAKIRQELGAIASSLQSIQEGHDRLTTAEDALVDEIGRSDRDLDNLIARMQEWT